MDTFAKKYQPASCKNIVGQGLALSQLKDFVVNFKRQKKKLALIYGPSGVGKTCSVYAIANDLDYEVIEVNASDFRNKEFINSIVGNALGQQSLFAKGKLILVDEIEGLSGTKDRGGINAVISLASDSRYPIVVTAMNPYSMKLRALKSKSLLIKFEPLSCSAISDVLKMICDSEKIKYNEETLKSLARRVGGDLRGAINDLQALAEEGEITAESVESASERRKIETITNALTRIFKTTDADVAKNAFDDVEEDMNERFLWIDENLPSEYSGEDLARAYENLSRADVFMGRIMRWQHWRFLVYADALLTAGIASSKKEKNRKTIDYKPTSRLLKIWWAKQKSMKKKAIAAKIAERTHCSKKRALEQMSYFQNIFKSNKHMAQGIAEELGLDEEEVEWLEK